MAKWFKNVNLVKHYFSFILTLVSVIGFFLLAWFKGVDVGSVVPVLVASYIGARSLEKSVQSVAASRDKDCSTRQVLADINGINISDNEKSN